MTQTWGARKLSIDQYETIASAANGQNQWTTVGKSSTAEDLEKRESVGKQSTLSENARSGHKAATQVNDLKPEKGSQTQTHEKKNISIKEKSEANPVTFKNFF